MRLPALAALAALAACSVKLEGAPCASDANCPAEQVCDLGGAAVGRCVTCVPDPACTADGFACLDATTLRECRTSVASCRHSVVTSCGSQGLVCRTPVGDHATCACDLNPGPTLFADAVSGSASGAPTYPTGIASPAQCRFRKLGDALAAASAGSTVKMTGWTAGEVKFSAAATGEAFPLQVKAGVTLTTADASPAPAHYVIEVDQAGPMRPALQLDHGAAASGFTVRPGAGGSASAAVLVSCAAAGTLPVSVSNLVIDGKGTLAASAVGDGLHLLGTCGVGASALLVENGTGAGIRVETSFPLGGPLPAVSIAGSTIRANGDGGLVVSVDASNGRPSLSVTSNDITLNGATTGYTDGTVTRRGGGVVLQGRAPSPLAFTGNAVHGNSYDQVLVASSDSVPWNLSGAACDATSNVFTCYDATTTGGPWFGLGVLGGATVNASNDSWFDPVPAAGMDYYKTPASAVNASPACAQSTLTCP